MTADTNVDRPILSANILAVVTVLRPNMLISILYLVWDQFYALQN